MTVLGRAPPTIAILEADILMPELEAQYGRYTDIFSRLLTAGAESAMLPTPKFSGWDILNHPDTYPDPAEYDAILITGSRRCSSVMTTDCRILDVRG
jgi:hypothetical protein